MGGAVPKQFLALGGEPLVVHSLRVLQRSPAIDQIILAVPQVDLDYCLNDLAVRFGFSKIRRVVAGGKERQVLFGMPWNMCLKTHGLWSCMMRYARF